MEIPEIKSQLSAVYHKQLKDAGNFVFEVNAKASFGVQLGLKAQFGSVEGGIMTGDIGKIGWSNTKGAFAKYGDGKGHNFIGGGVKLFNKSLSAGGKLDYVTKDIVPTAGDLLEYYPNNGNLEAEGNIGPGKNILDPPSGSAADVLGGAIKTKARVSNKEDCAFCLDVGAGMKAILGVEAKIKIGFTGSED